MVSKSFSNLIYSNLININLLDDTKFDFRVVEFTNDNGIDFFSVTRVYSNIFLILIEDIFTRFILKNIRIKKNLFLLLIALKVCEVEASVACN